MVVYKCLICFREFNRKSSFIDHTENKKKSCRINSAEKIAEFAEINQNAPKCTDPSPKLTKINQNSPKLKKMQKNIMKKINVDKINIYNEKSNNTCNYCYKEFVNTYTLKRHMDNRCKVKKLDDEKKDEIFNKLLEYEGKMNKILNNFEDLKNDNNNLKNENEKLKKHIDNLENKYDNEKNKIVTKNINNTINNNITNNLIIPQSKLVKFGKEDLKKINFESIIKSCSDIKVSGYLIFVEIIKLIHFNDNLPEYQNVYITDRNRDKYMYWNEDNWTLGDNTVYNNIISKVQDIFMIYQDEIEEAKKNKNYKNVVDKITKYIDKYYDYDGFNDLVDPKVKDLLYNNREKVKNNYKKIQNDIEKNKIKIIS